MKIILKISNKVSIANSKNMELEFKFCHMLLAMKDKKGCLESIQGID